MDNRYLPSLKKINIRNFSLYPGDLNFTYNFIDGINLIIGGNGVGKTTFLNILKFALIGLYKKGIDVKRREVRGVEYRHEKRVNLPYNFFSNRMDPNFQFNEDAEVTITFKIGESTFEVTRNLYIPTLKKVVIINKDETYELSGNIIIQSDFDSLFSDKQKNERILQDTLQWKFEEIIGKVSNHEFFDNIIFIVNDILFFSESRKTIMWDSIVQNKLASKYFIDPLLDEKKERAEREGKYQDSLSRHKSEDIRAITKIISTIDDKDSNNKQFKDLNLELEKQKKAVGEYFKELERLQMLRDYNEVQLNILHSEKNQLTKRLEDLENLKRKEEQIIFDNIFKKVTPKYYDYLKSLKSSGDCPLCNNELPIEFFERLKNDDSHCMMCGNNINNTELISDKLLHLKSEIEETLLNKRQREKQIISIEDELKKLDKNFNSTSLSFNNSQSRLRKIEFAIQKSSADPNSKVNSEFKAMQARINELEREKESAQIKSKNAYSAAQKIDSEIDTQRLESREKLSDIFNQFASKFLGVPCELVYEDPKDNEGKRYLPRINGIDRLHEEELSESQRFFIDQSFRMSLLNFFNSSSSFFMCETPDSSLDISYEKNAAKIFLEYIKKPNELIITSNLNNSEFLENLINEARAINYINLLKIGKQSTIQSNSTELLKASNKIEKLINERPNK